jgi:drug/metabolite transporter (DMT)-like permease
VRTSAKGILITGTGAVVLSFEGVIVQLLDSGPLTILLWRGPLMAAGFVGIFWLGWARGGGLWRGLRAVGGIGVLAAALFAADNVLFIVALTRTSVANTLLILSAAPVFSALLGRVVLGDRVGGRTWAVIAAVLAGVAVILFGSLGGSLGGGALLGDLAALGAAVSIAGTLVLIRRARGVVMLPSMALGALAAAVAVAPFADPRIGGASDLALLVLLGLVVAPVAFGCIAIGPRYLPAHEVSLLMLLETVLGPVWAWAALGSAPAASTLAGGAVVVFALVTNSVLALRRPAAAAA